MDDLASTSAWEDKKENVEPLRRGRHTKSLNAALQPTDNDRTQLQKERKSFEDEILADANIDDPIDVWDRYLKWTDQNFPVGGNKEHYLTLLARIFRQFWKVDKYKNDERYIRVCLLYASLVPSENAIKIYHNMYKQKIAVESLTFFASWTQEYENCGNLKQANMVLQNFATKYFSSSDEKLLKLQRDFDLRSARKIAEIQRKKMDSGAGSKSEKERQALGDLRTFGSKKKVGSIRPTQGTTVTVKQRKENLPQAGNSRLQVFADADENRDADVASTSAAAPELLVPEEKENRTGAPSVWQGKKVKQTRRAAATVTSSLRNNSTTSSFTIFTEEEAPSTPSTATTGGQQAASTNRSVLQQSTTTTRAVAGVEVYLSAHKDLIHSQNSELHRKILLNQKDDEQAIRMYPVDKVYAPMGEFQLEEVFAARWKAQQKKKEKERLQLQERQENERKLAEEKAAAELQTRQVEEMLQQQAEELRKKDETLRKREEQIKQLCNAFNNSSVSDEASTVAEEQEEDEEATEEVGIEELDNSPSEVTKCYTKIFQQLREKQRKCTSKTPVKEPETGMEESCLLPYTSFDYGADDSMKDEDGVGGIGDQTGDLLDLFSGSPDKSQQDDDDDVCDSRGETSKRHRLNDSVVAVEEKSLKLSDESLALPADPRDLSLVLQEDLHLSKNQFQNSTSGSAFQIFEDRPDFTGKPGFKVYEEKPSAGSKSGFKIFEENPSTGSKSGFKTLEEKPSAGFQVFEEPSVGSKAGFQVFEEPSVGSKAGFQVFEEPSTVSKAGFQGFGESSVGSKAGFQVFEEPSVGSKAGFQVFEEPSTVSKAGFQGFGESSVGSKAGFQVFEEPSVGSKAGFQVFEEPSTVSKAGFQGFGESSVGSKAGFQVFEEPSVGSKAGFQVFEEPSTVSKAGFQGFGESSVGSKAGFQVFEEPSVGSKAGFQVFEEPSTVSKAGFQGFEESSVGSKAGFQVFEEPSVGSKARFQVFEEPSTVSKAGFQGFGESSVGSKAGFQVFEEPSVGSKTGFQVFEEPSVGSKAGFQVFEEPSVGSKAGFQGFGESSVGSKAGFQVFEEPSVGSKAGFQVFEEPSTGFQIFKEPTSAAKPGFKPFRDTSTNRSGFRTFEESSTGFKLGFRGRKEPISAAKPGFQAFKDTATNQSVSHGSEPTSAAKPGFQIFKDTTTNQYGFRLEEPSSAAKPGFKDSKILNESKLAFEDVENEENTPPKGYQEGKKRTGLSGILQPAVGFQLAEDAMEDDDFIEIPPDDDVDSDDDAAPIHGMMMDESIQIANRDQPFGVEEIADVTQSAFERRAAISAESTSYFPHRMMEPPLCPPIDEIPLADIPCTSAPTAAAAAEVMMTPQLNASRPPNCYQRYYDGQSCVLSRISERSKESSSSSCSSAVRGSGGSQTNTTTPATTAVATTSWNRHHQSQHVIKYNDHTINRPQFSDDCTNVMSRSFLRAGAKMNPDETQMLKDESSCWGNTGYFDTTVNPQQQQQISPVAVTTTMSVVTDPWNEAMHRKVVDASNDYTQHLALLVNRPGPKIKRGNKAQLGGYWYTIHNKIASGGFANIHLALRDDGKKIAIKEESSASLWEAHMLNVTRRRLGKNEQLSEYLDALPFVHACINFVDKTLTLIDYYPNGSLLDWMNSCRLEALSIDKRVVALNVMKIIHSLHQISIIHGDIKPDNFMVVNQYSTSRGDRVPVLKLIDFGRSIDMSAYQKDTVFIARSQTSCYECPQMLEGTPWNLHIDLFAIAASIYPLAFSSFLKPIKHEESGKWKVPQRRLGEIWEIFYDELLNFPTPTNAFVPSFRDSPLPKLIELFQEQRRH